MWGRLVRWRWWVGGVGLLVVAVVVVVAVWPSSGPAGPYRPAPRARVYNAATICLLTGPLGVTGAAAPVWAGVEKASGATSDQAEFLAAVGSVETVGSVTPFVNTLVERQCTVIVAVGAVEVEAAGVAASGDAATRFLLVDGGSAATASNVSVVSGASANTVATAVESTLSKN